MAERVATQHVDEPNPLDTTGLCLLSLDGGGVRGLSTLYILQGLMRRLNHERESCGLSSTKPCEVFDLIGGTSTGGLIAIMLGRLEMDVDECIAAYIKLMKTVFEKRSSRFPVDWALRINARFDSTRLKAAIEEVIKSKGAVPTDPFNDRKRRGCRTFVCSVAKEINNIVRLRSYTLPDESAIDATICEAALATSAATSFFAPVSIGARQFVDGALGANNPVDEVEGEAANIWSSGSGEVKPLVKCFISIGTGVPSKKALNDNALKFMSVNLKEISTQTEKTEERFIARWARQYDEHRYFRFNVRSALESVGLAEYEKHGLMESATESYLKHQTQKSLVRNCVKNLQQKQNETELSFASTIKKFEVHGPIASETTVNMPCWLVPLERNHKFVGRDSYLNKLEDASFSEHYSSKFAVTGLGGVGKTQVVLEFAHRTKQKHQDCSVFWVPATNTDSLQQSFIDIGKQLRIPGMEDNPADVKKLVQRRLSQEAAGQWLLIVDNVDDNDIWQVELREHLPKSQRGFVVCTTRSMQVAVNIAGTEVLDVAEMDEEMAMQLLTKLLIQPVPEAHHRNAEELLEQLTFLPLAITQAAAYINANRLILSDYLLLLHEKEEDVIELLSEDFADEGRYNNVKNPVATTWLISFDEIQRQNPFAAEYLSFMSCINPKDIPQSLLPPGRSQKQEIDAIGILSAYSFVTRRTTDKALEVHRLVHLATRNWLKTKEQLNEWNNQALERLADLTTWGDHDQRAIWRTYLPHARYILDHTTNEEEVGDRTDLLGQYAYCLCEDGRFKEASTALSSCAEIFQQVLGESNPETLSIRCKLADTYRKQGEWKKAEDLYLQILKIQVTILSEDDQSISITRGNLAIAYVLQGRWQEAEDLQVKSKDNSLRVFGQDHRETLTRMGNLALTYSDQGRWKEAEELQVQVLESHRRVLGEEHPETLISIGNLALTYSNQGRWKEAEELQVQVLESHRRVLGEEHSDTLTSINNLALTYNNQGRWKEAEELQVRVLEGRRRVLEEKHPDTLTSIGSLALTYSNQGQWKEAEELQVQVLESRRRVLGEEHPDTLSSIGNLASTYCAQGQWKEAEELEVQVLERSRRVLGEEHPDTLITMNNLAWTFRNQNHLRKAIPLMEECTQLQEKVLGSRHPYTIDSLGALNEWRLEAEGTD